MEFKTKKAPIIRNHSRSYKRSLTLHFALILVTVVSLFIQTRIHTLEDSFNAILIIVVAVLLSVVFEVFYALSDKNLQKFESYQAFVSPINIALVVALLLPYSTPIYVVALAIFIAIYPAKLIYGGDGYYIFNPALVGVLFVQISFESVLTLVGTPLMLLKETMEGATHTFDILELFTGEYVGLGLGTTSVILLSMAFIYLVVTKVIDLKISGTFLISMFVLTLIIGYFNGYWLDYVLINMITGFTIFGATFLISETVSSPTSRETKIIYASIVALMTVMVRVLGGQVEGIVFAVLFGNLLTPYLNRTVKRSNKKTLIKTLVFVTVLIVGSGIALGYISMNNIEDALESVNRFGVMLS
ncbi:MAG: RnfABCDGE type electron transport complex subunit D [Candidatus Izemoplasma sp.]